MTITLNHTIVPARDKVDAARFFARIFGLSFDGSSDHFAPVRVNETLTLLFDEDTSFESHHYAFHVSETEFDAIFGRIKEAKSRMAALLGVSTTASSTIEWRPRRLFQGPERSRA
jgi:catechol 2,3-dioxygenase-like lactoylglutathione lyase family enzyme